MESNTETSRIEEAQLTKLNLEIEDLQRKRSWAHWLLQFLPLLAILVAAGGLWLSASQFFAAQETRAQSEATARATAEQQRKETSERDTASRENEFRKPFWDKQLALYFEATNVASTIATLPSADPERKDAEKRFWQLYWGPLVAVEDEGVKVAKLHFRNCLKGYDVKCLSEPGRTDQLQSLSLALANSCRASISKSWKVELDNLYMQDVKRTDLP